VKKPTVDGLFRFQSQHSKRVAGEREFEDIAAKGYRPGVRRNLPRLGKRISSAPLSEVNTMAVPWPARVFATDKLTSVSSGLGWR